MPLTSKFTYLTNEWHCDICGERTDERLCPSCRELIDDELTTLVDWIMENIAESRTERYMVLEAIGERTTEIE